MKKNLVASSLLFFMLLSVNAEAQSFKNLLKAKKGEAEYFKPQSLSCEVWIGRNQILYCKTDAQIYEATIQFLVPSKNDHHSPHWSENTTPLKIDLKKPAGSDTYEYDMRKENFELIQRINLKLTTRFFTTEVMLPNEKIPMLK